METALLLLLTVMLTDAKSLRTPQRQAVGATEDLGSSVKREGLTPELNIIPFHSDDKRPHLENSLAPRSRARRDPQRGCQLGTCQLHNLASTLYQISRTNGKDESKSAHDPQGYGK